MKNALAEKKIGSANIFINRFFSANIINTFSLLMGKEK